MATYTNGEPLSYTYGATPTSVIRERLPRQYSMRLCREDMLLVLEALLVHDTSPATGLRSAILSTLDIEEV